MGEWIFQQRDPFAELPALAKRLGVEPMGDDHAPTYALQVSDGRRYCLFEIMNALLDRMDAANGEKADG